MELFIIGFICGVIVGSIFGVGLICIFQAGRAKAESNPCSGCLRYDECELRDAVNKDCRYFLKEREKE